TTSSSLSTFSPCLSLKSSPHSQFAVFKPIFDPRYSTKIILIIPPLIQNFVPSFLSVLLYPVKRDVTLVWLRFHI
ncbi:hypothetical protein BDR04DRAFT_1099256, partial [Suillus decipiens]